MRQRCEANESLVRGLLKNGGEVGRQGIVLYPLPYATHSLTDLTLVESLDVHSPLQCRVRRGGRGEATALALGVLLGSPVDGSEHPLHDLSD